MTDSSEAEPASISRPFVMLPGPFGSIDEFREFGQRAEREAKIASLLAPLATAATVAANKNRWVRFSTAVVGMAITGFTLLDLHCAKKDQVEADKLDEAVEAGAQLIIMEDSRQA